MEANAKRKLKDGAAYDALITPTDHRDKLIAKEAGVPDTLTLVQRVAVQYRGEVAKLAQKLAVRGSGADIDLIATAQAIWNFVYQHIQYHLDEPGLEQVRHPARSWADRVRGVDCEDYAVFISALLQNLGIPHLLRISAYKGGWQHIYVIVPKGRRLPAVDTEALAALPTAVFTEDYTKSIPDRQHLLRKDYLTLDCVTDEYDFEVAPSKTMNLAMPMLYELSGFDENSVPAEEMGELTDTQLVASYPSESGHIIGVGDLGGFFVRDDGDLGELGELGAIGKFKPLAKVRKALANKKLISRKVKRGGLIKKLVGTGGSFRNPADIPGATSIAAAWPTTSGHYVGIDHLGSLYVMDTNDEVQRLGQLSGLDVNDPELAGWLKNAFKKVGNVAKKVGSGIASGVQKGVFDNLNKIPGVKYLADNYGSEILQAAGGVALTAFTGGAAAPVLLAAKAAKAGSVAAKIAKAASLANKAKKAVQLASKAKKVVKAVGVAKKAVKVVKVAQKVSTLLPRKAQTGMALPLSQNPQPLSFQPVAPNQVQDFAPMPLNLVQRVDEFTYATPAGPSIPLSPETMDASAYISPAVRPTASVVEPDADVPADDDAGTYAEESYENGLQAAGEEVGEEMGQLGALGLSTTGVVAIGGAVLALGLAAIFAGQSTAAPRRASSGLSGTPKGRKKSSSTTKRGRSRIINL